MFPRSLALIVLFLCSLAACSGKSHKVTVSWKPSTTPYVMGYYVYRSDEPGKWAKITDKPVHENSYTDSKVKSGKTYAYRVTTLSGGLESEPSEEIYAKVP